MLSMIVRPTLAAVAVIAALTPPATLRAPGGSASASEQTPVYRFNDVLIRMERTSCFGTCPVYSIELHGDGSGTYTGQKHVNDAGPHTFRVGHAEVVRLLTAFFNVRFFELRDKYDDFATLAPRGDDKFEVVMSSDSDLPTTVLRLQIADQSKTIVLRDNYPAELRELTEEDLVAKLRESKEELFNLRFQMATGQLDNNRRLRVVRHEIARIYTVMRERELGLATGPAGKGDAA